MTQDGRTFDVRAQGASVVQVETLGRHGIIVLWFAAFISAASIAFSAFAWHISSIAERESRLAQYELTLIRPALRELGISTEDQETHEEETQ